MWQQPKPEIEPRESEVNDLLKKLIANQKPKEPEPLSREEQLNANLKQLLSSGQKLKKSSSASGIGQMLNELQKRKTDLASGIQSVQAMQSSASLNQAVMASLQQQELSPKEEQAVREEEISLMEDNDQVLQQLLNQQP
mmetsp:Transcript_1211/g.1370  ORF Transcript_1211/g.1370 Transcript_1211/m.1370 type:complete len:139 (+) Transcript_1211:1119-1535(+)